MARRENDLGNDKISSLILRLAIPAMVAQFVNVLYGIVDRIFIGNIEVIGNLALSGVGVCAPIVTLITSFSFLVGLGGSPLMAMRLGEGNKDAAQKIMSNSFFMLIITSIIITAVFLIFKKPMLMAFGASVNTFQYANEYLTIYAAGAVFSIVATGMNSFITAQGYSKISMMTVLIGAIINIILDPILIFACGLNVIGAAIATVISQAVSAIWVILFLLGKRSVVKLTLKGLAGKIMGKIMKFGVTPFLVIMTDSLVLIMFNAQLQRYGNGMGDMLVGAGVIVSSFMQLITMPMGGITMGCQPIISFNYGACKTDRVKRAFIGLNIICIIFCVIMFVLALTLGKYFVMMFTDDPAMSAEAIKGIRIYTIGVIILALQYACVDGLTALGQPQASLPLSLVRKIGVMTVCIYLLPMTSLGYEGVFWAEPLADIISGLLSSTVALILVPRVLKKKQALGITEVNY